MTSRPLVLIDEVGMTEDHGAVDVDLVERLFRVVDLRTAANACPARDPR
jgi:hypothetical protein